jgi:4-alpha-glucanotransferase
MILSPEKKIAGVLAPLFALRRENDLGIGDLETLRQFVDWAAGIGFKLVQLLPINEVGGDHSPYNAISAVALEPTTLHLAPGSPEDLTREDFDEVIGGFDLEKLRKGAVKHDRVRRLKMALLEKAHLRLAQRREADKIEFKAFCETEAEWLNDYAFFRALMDENGGRETWDQWREGHRGPDSARDWLAAQTAGVRERFSERESFFKYVQWVGFGQWSAMRAYAEERGIALMGDVPFGVNLYSADVYSRRDQFALDWSGGAPPEPYFKDDEFTQKWGQNWGIPLYRWDIMRTRNLDWWRWRVRGVRKIFHFFRIDHVLGFYRIYAFPWRPARNPEMLPLSFDQMRERTGGAFPPIRLAVFPVRIVPRIKLREPAAPSRSFIRGTIRTGKTARRIGGKARNTSARSWKNPETPAWPAKTSGRCRITSGRVCVRWAWPGSRFHSGKIIQTAALFPVAIISDFP